MARVTVEDCLKIIPNRFELVILASHRAKEIVNGSPLKVERDGDKNPVVALREIAKELQEVDHLRSAYIRGLRKVSNRDDILETQTHNVLQKVDEDPFEQQMSQESLIDDDFMSIESYNFDDEDEEDK